MSDGGFEGKELKGLGLRNKVRGSGLAPTSAARIPCSNYDANQQPEPGRSLDDSPSTRKVAGRMILCLPLDAFDNFTSMSCLWTPGIHSQ